MCHSVFRFAVSAAGSAQLHPRLTAAARRTAVGSWGKASREKSQKEKAGLLTCSSFWLSLLDSGQRPYESKYSRKPVGLGTPFLLLLTLLHLRLPASATGGGRLRCRLKSAKGGRTDVGWWFKSNKQNQKNNSRPFGLLLFFWLSLLDLNQRPTD